MCPNCGEERPYLWLGGFHCDETKKHRPENWSFAGPYIGTHGMTLTEEGWYVKTVR